MGSDLSPRPIPADNEGSREVPPREPRGLVPQGKRRCFWVLAVLTGKPEIRVISPKKKGVRKAERRSGADSPHPGCRYPGTRGLWLKHRLWSAGRAFSFPALKNALFIPSDILFLCFSGVYFFAVLVAVAVTAPALGTGRASEPVAAV